MGSKVSPVFNINTQQLKGPLSEERDKETFYTSLNKLTEPDELILNLPNFNYCSEWGGGTLGTISYYVYDNQDIMTGFLNAEFMHANVLDHYATSFYQNRPYVRITNLFEFQLPWFNLVQQLTIMTRMSKYNGSMIALFNLFSFSIDSHNLREFERQFFLIIIHRLNTHLVDPFTLFNEETREKRLPNEVEQELDDIINREPEAITVELAKILYNLLFGSSYEIDLPIVYAEFEVLVVTQKLTSVQKIAGGYVKNYNYYMPVVPQPTYIEIKMSNDMDNFSVLLKVN